MFSIVIPLYNEEKNIINLLYEIEISLTKYNKYEIILVDDASLDETLKIINDHKNTKIKIFKNNVNTGQSYSITKGINNSSYDIIVTLDGDGQNDPRDIPRLLDLYFSFSNCKLVGGIRKKRMDNFIKIISSRIANFIRSKILNDGCKDTGCSLKVFDKNIFLKFPYFNGIHRFLPALFRGYGYRTDFIEVNHRIRKYGYSKYGTFIRLVRGIVDMFKVINIIKNKN